MVFLIIPYVANTQANRENQEILPKELFLKYIPENYELLRCEFGNLNNDIIKDALLFLEPKKGDTIESGRKLLILIGRPTGGFDFLFENSQILHDATLSALGEPIINVFINNGTFSITQVTGGYSYAEEVTVFFKYSSKVKDWFLHKVIEETWERDRSSGSVIARDNKIKTYETKNLISTRFVNFSHYREHLR